jgi:hypothetical protein
LIFYAYLLFQKIKITGSWQTIKSYIGTAHWSVDTIYFNGFFYDNGLKFFSVKFIILVIFVDYSVFINLAKKNHMYLLLQKLLHGQTKCKPSADYPFGILIINIIIGLFYFWLQSIHGNNISKIVIMMFTTGHQKEFDTCHVTLANC